MPREGYVIPGGINGVLDPSATSKGAYAPYSAYSPRYHTGGGDGADSILSQARLFIQIPASARRSLSDTKRGVGKYLRALESKVDAQGRPSGGYVDLLIQGVNLSRSERHEEHIDLADSWSSYFFGSNPWNGSFSGVVYNTRQDDWLDAWIQIWSPILRGTALVTRGARLKLWHDTRIYDVSPVDENYTITAQQEITATVNVQFLVPGIQIVPSPWVHSEPTLLDQLRVRTNRNTASALVERARQEAAGRSSQQTLIESGPLVPVPRDTPLRGPAAFGPVAAGPRPTVSADANIASGGVGLWAV